MALALGPPGRRAVLALLALAAGELARRAGAAAAAGDAAAACGLFEQALGLWQGEPAADVAVLRGHPAVAELARRRAQLVAGYAQAACGLGWHERVIPLLEGLARAEPLNERVHARLMVALAGAGQQAAAFAVFEVLRRRLDEELGVYPGAELAEAHQRVLRQDVPARPATPRRAGGDTPCNPGSSISEPGSGRTARDERARADRPTAGKPGRPSKGLRYARACSGEVREASGPLGSWLLAARLSGG